MHRMLKAPSVVQKLHLNFDGSDSALTQIARKWLCTLFMELLLLSSALLVAGAFAGVTAGLFGNGGGFVVVPALLFVFGLLGYQGDVAMYVAVGTSLATITISSARSVQTHKSLGSVDFSVLRSWAPWLGLGVLGGLLIAHFTSGESLYLVFAVGVGIYSFYFLFPKSLDRFAAASLPSGKERAGLATFLGGFSALLGIGGGTITVITMTLCGRPICDAVGTAAGVGCIIGLVGAIGFALLGLAQSLSGLPPGSVGFINLPALFAVSAASLVTAPMGARMAHRLNDLLLKRLFGVYLLAVSAVMFLKTF